jgi:hypothetical protein
MSIMLRRIGLLIVLLCAGMSAALAQTAETPVMGSTGTAAATEEKQLTQILVIGDALAGGLGAGLSRMADTETYVVTNRFNEESGLARPEVYDWADRLPKILESNSFDVIVVMLGTNDRQQIRDGNLRYAFGTPEWTQAYEAQLDRLLNELAASGASIYWIGLPPMGDPEYDEAMTAISALQKARAEAKDVRFIDMRPFFLSEDGRYTDMGKDDNGAMVKLRGRDGVSFFKTGNNRMGGIVLDAIAKAEPAAVPEEDTSAGIAAEAAIVRAPLPQRAVPEFGQALLQGEPLTMRPRDISTTALLVLGRGSSMSPAEASAALASITEPGSAAAALFTDGVILKPPAGRLDDFSVPPRPAAE